MVDEEWVGGCELAKEENRSSLDADDEPWRGRALGESLRGARGALGVCYFSGGYLNELITPNPNVVRRNGPNAQKR